jgi:Lrp/AsnC family transcriptional regulator for asnA, asnC and gidA
LISAKNEMNFRRFDKDDWQIVRLLNADGRRSSASIARELGLPPRTVRNRIERLLDDGAIRPTAIVNHEFFGYDMVVDVLCEAEGSELEEIGNSLARLSGTRYVAYRIGESDISVQVLLRSPAELEDLIASLEELPGMHRMKVIPLRDVLKNTHDWVPPESDFQE